jgi:hypothetical protein
VNTMSTSQVCELPLSEGVHAYKKGWAKVHAAPSRETKGQGQRRMIRDESVRRRKSRTLILKHKSSPGGDLPTLYKTDPVAALRDFIG